jgi:hypothetical protein
MRLIPDEELAGVNNLLKTKPIVKYDEEYIIPSFSMLIWCKVTAKPKSFISDKFKLILEYLERSNIPDKTKIMLEMLDVSCGSMKKLTDYMKTIKSQFIRDGELHDCSIGTTYGIDYIGITCMIGPDKKSVSDLLNKYCIITKDNYQV